MGMTPVDGRGGRGQNHQAGLAEHRVLADPAGQLDPAHARQDHVDQSHRNGVILLRRGVQQVQRRRSARGQLGFHVPSRELIVQDQPAGGTAADDQHGYAVQQMFTGERRPGRRGTRRGPG